MTSFIVGKRAALAFSKCFLLVINLCFLYFFTKAQHFLVIVSLHKYKFTFTVSNDVLLLSDQK